MIDAAAGQTLELLALLPPLFEADPNPMSEPEEPTSGSTSPASRPARRSFLRAALGAGAALASQARRRAMRLARRPRSTRPAAAGSDNPEARLPAVPFHGLHQAGILPKPQQQTAVLSFTVTAEGRGELTDLFQTLTDRARFLTAGGTPPPVGITGPPSDSGILGPSVVPDGLTVTVGVGASLFDDRFRPGRPKARAPDHDGALP